MSIGDGLATLGFCYVLVNITNIIFNILMRKKEKPSNEITTLRQELRELGLL